jgi:3-phenylpropionate/trans-cinnamate dioxygenase ferredoxin component
MADFITVARTSDVPDGARIIVAYRRDDVVLFNVGGRYYAVEDRCSHEDVPLSDGYIDGDELECSAHGARFDLKTGKPTAPPAFAPVRRYEVRVEGDEIQISR